MAILLSIYYVVVSHSGCGVTLRNKKSAEREFFSWFPSSPFERAFSVFTERNEGDERCNKRDFKFSSFLLGKHKDFPTTEGALPEPLGMPGGVYIHCNFVLFDILLAEAFVTSLSTQSFLTFSYSFFLFTFFSSRLGVINKKKAKEP